MNGGNERERPWTETAQEAHKQCPLQSSSCSQMTKYYFKLINLEDILVTFILYNYFICILINGKKKKENHL